MVQNYKGWRQKVLNPATFRRMMSLVVPRNWFQGVMAMKRLKNMLPLATHHSEIMPKWSEYPSQMLQGQKKVKKNHFFGRD